MVEDAYASSELTTDRWPLTAEHFENNLWKPGDENRPRLGHLSTEHD